MAILPATKEQITYLGGRKPMQRKRVSGLRDIAAFSRPLVSRVDEEPEVSSQAEPAKEQTE